MFICYLHVFRIFKNKHINTIHCPTVNITACLTTNANKKALSTFIIIKFIILRQIMTFALEETAYVVEKNDFSMSLDYHWLAKCFISCVLFLKGNVENTTFQYTLANKYRRTYIIIKLVYSNITIKMLLEYISFLLTI